MFEEIGHHVEKIKRVRYGPLSLDIPPGEFRRLSAAEVEKLKAVSGVRKTTVRREAS
jgi:23S rRNA pseudouridine2605 synthase